MSDGYREKVLFDTCDKMLFPCRIMRVGLYRRNVFCQTSASCLYFFPA